MEELFATVAALVRDTPPLVATNDEKLQLYGLYKHIVDGPCPGDTLPSIFQAVARAKYLAWEECQCYSKQEAMREYIRLMTAREDDLGARCQELWQNFKMQKSGNQGEESKTTSKERPPETMKSQSSRFKEPRNYSILQGTQLLVTSWMTYLFGLIGVCPMIPRGRLDISFSDLFFALYQCCSHLWRRDEERRCNQLQDQIVTLWNTAETNSSEAIVGFSVRSLFDLYLCTKKYPKQSEVIVFPPISVPGMMQVANYHNLNLVGVDILDSKDWWNFNGIQQAIYDQKTVAIMIVHPFGMLTVSEEQMRQIRRLADDHNLEVWEDCAECFTGLNNSAYLGSKDVADVRFFSFGMIKTATALGCGVAILRNTAVVRHMERLQQSLCKRQSTLEFFKRVSLSLILNFMSGSPLLFGMLVSLSSICGFNYDKIVTSSIRGFPTMPSSKRYSHSEASYYRLLQSHIRSQIRKRPCPALLALFLRRLQQQSILSSSIAQRIKRCQQLDASLRKDLPESILLPNNNENTYWAFPIFCDNPSSTSQQLQTRGFDAVRWASQLCCIAGKTKEDGNSCQKTQALMNSVLYLPISSQTLSPESTRKLADFLRRCLTKSSSDNDTNVSKAFFQLKWNVLAGLYMAWLTMVWKSMGFTNMLTTFIWSGTSIAWFLGITAVILICSQHVLRLGVSSLYLNHAHWFKHFDMVNAATTDEVIHTDTTTSGKQNILSEMETLRLPYILLDDTDHGTSGRKVLLTGATGFVGSLLLRDLLLHRKQLSIMGGIIVISRGKGKKSAKARIDALLAKPMFEFLSDVEKRDLVHTIEGDVTKASLGLSNNDFSCIVQDTSISHVFHSAAAVSFTQDLPDAARSNITSTLGMQSLTAQLKSKDVQFVHISTAFVHGDRTGTFLSPLTEKVFSLGPFDPAEIYKSMLSTEFYATKAMTELGFPNTYAFSKCVCEHLLLQRNDANTLIIRPSIVGPAVESPFEGWAGGKPSTLVAASMLYLSLPWNIWHLPPAAVAYIPVDVLCRFVLSKAFSAIANTLDANSQESSSSGSSFQEIGRMSDSSSDSGEIVSMASSTKNSHRIFNATWDNKSNGNAIFTWLDFGVAQCHLAVITGCVTRPTAMCALYVCAVLMPKLSPNAPLFQQMHSLFVLGPISILVKILDRIKLSQPGLAKIVPFLDLPLLFFPFVKASFHFQSDLTAPNSFDAKRYAFGCGVAANRFLSSIRSNSRDRDSKGVPQSERDLQPTLSMLPIGGEIHKIGTTDFWWAISQPIGSYPIRLAAYIFTKILRAVSLLVTVDVVSFQNTYSSIQRRDGITTCIVLAPTHRSFFDFILLSYVVFSIPELQLDIPYIVAADEFEQLPLIGIIARLLRAFYVQRGKGCPDKDLSLNLASLKEKKLSWPSGCLEVFIEGKRSRDRRFVSPKTGLLKSLKESGGDHVIVPICINYEVIPEQKQLSAEASGSPRGNLNVIGMVKWLMDAIRGKINIGKIHIAASGPLLMQCQRSEEFKKVVRQVQSAQQDLVCVSDYHVLAASRFFEMEILETRRAMTQLGCKFWPGMELGSRQGLIPELPHAKSDLCSIVFQFSHQIAPLFYSERKKWSVWLDQVNDCEGRAIKPQQYTKFMYDYLLNYFDAADKIVNQALEKLRERGYQQPKRHHIFQTASKMNDQVPLLLLKAALEMKMEDLQDQSIDVCPLIDAINSYQLESEEKLGFWGYHDCGFVVKVGQRGQRHVIMKGARYELCGSSLSKLLPFIESEMQVQINPLKEFSPVSPVWSQTSDSRFSDSEKELLYDSFPQTSFSTVDRVRHGTGHSQEDIFLIRTGSSFRIPDAVVWPQCESDVEKLVGVAKDKRWCLIPFGGGTNVSNATRCPASDVEHRPIISVDMKQMRRILWINEEDGLAHIEAGITGRELVEELEQQGLTMGHEPDSYEFSTLGGWVATKASGMKRSKYGNIEDIVKSVRVIGPDGLLWEGSENSVSTPGRVAEGLDLCSLVMGSEGCIGIITSAVIRVWPLPEVREYDSVIIRNFQEGLQFVRAIARLGPNKPASVRLLDNAHFRLGQALRPEESSILRQFTKSIIQFASSAISTYDPASIVCATINYEGSIAEIKAQKRTIREIASSHGGMMLGSQIGKAGYELTFMIAYLRDFAMTYHLLGESFETFVPWSRIETLISATKEKIAQEHVSRFLPGKPFVGCRVTQLYHEGVCLYFYLCFSFEGVDNASEIFSELEKAARSEILKQGGSLSHHHGIGKLRAPLLKERVSPALSKSIDSIKQAIDNDNIFGARNGHFATLK